MDPGNYQIVNMAGSGDLAVQYNGQDTDLTVVKRENIPALTWVVAGYPNTPQSISPQLSQNLYTNPAGNYVQPQTSPYYWNIGTGSGITVIQNDTQTLSWALTTAEAGQKVTLVPSGSGLENWSFIPVGN